MLLFPGLVVCACSSLPLFLCFHSSPHANKGASGRSLIGCRLTPLCRELIASSATADGPARALLLLLLLLLLLDARAPVIVSNGRSASELTEEEFTVNGQLKKRRDVKRRRRRWRKRRTGDSASTGFGEPR